LRPHDLIWLTARDALEGITESWVEAAWHTGLPVVVRRDVDSEGRIPVGVRGLRRDQRAAGWVKPENVQRVVSPEDLCATADLLRSPFVTQPPVQVALQLAQQAWPWTWGIT
ncbi:malonate decarboxylase holo-ACP synthase, partial [Raoultella ornithinolytica]